MLRLHPRLHRHNIIINNIIFFIFQTPINLNLKSYLNADLNAVKKWSQKLTKSVTKFLELDSQGIRSKFLYHEIEHRSRNFRNHIGPQKFSSHEKINFAEFSLNISKN